MLLKMPKCAYQKGREKTLAFWRRIFQYKRYVYVWDMRPNGLGAAGEINFRRYTSADDVDDRLRLDITELLGDNAIKVMKREFDKGSVLWLAFFGNTFVGHQWTRLGLYFTHWYIPLKDNDFVFYGAGVKKDFRGRQISPKLKIHIITQDEHLGGKAYVDVMVWNRSNIRALEKAGFKRVAMCRADAVIQFRWD